MSPPHHVCVPVPAAATIAVTSAYPAKMPEPESTSYFVAVSVW